MRSHMGDRDFKYVIQDMSNIYIGARFSYGELMEEEEVPYKLKKVIFRIYLQEVPEETTPENHIFLLNRDSASYRALRKMKVHFRMSVWDETKGKKGGAYVNREYGLDEILDDSELQGKRDKIVVEEMRISKLGLAAVIV